MQHDYLTLVKEKSTVLERILQITKEYQFTGQKDLVEKEAEEFSELYTRREDIFERAKKLDDALKTTVSLNTQTAELARLIEEQNGMVKEILTIDEANMKMYDTFKAHLVSDLKGVVQSKHINERYVDDFEASGHYFDKRN